MAATKNCDACSDLQENSPEFVLNGVTNNVYNSLINDTGFNPASGHDDCTDLNNANDCLIGNMEDEVDSYDVCGWKEFMPDFIHNLWTTLKAIIAAICGIWIKVRRFDCAINYMFEGATFNIGEEATDNSYAVAGKGVSFLESDSSGVHSTDLHLDYIAGGLMRGGGSYKFHTSSFDEPNNTKVWNFDNGDEERHSYNRSANSVWGDTGRPANGGELICEFRIKQSAYPQIKKFFPGIGQESTAGAYHVRVEIFSGGEYAYGQHGNCNRSTGVKGDGTYDNGHLVPSGWVYVQIRLTYADLALAPSDGAQRSPYYFFGVRMNQNNIPC